MSDLYGHHVPQTPIFIATFIVAHVQLQNSMVHCRYLTLNILRSSLLLCDKDTHRKYKESLVFEKKTHRVCTTLALTMPSIGSSLGKRLEPHVRRLQFSWCTKNTPSQER